MIRRPPRSTLDRSSAASDVYKRQLLNEHLGFRGVRATEDSPRVGVDVTDLVLVSRVAPAVRPVAVVDEREDAAADRHARLTRMSGFLPRLTIRLDLLSLLHVQRRKQI